MFRVPTGYIQYRNGFVVLPTLEGTPTAVVGIDPLGNLFRSNQAGPTGSAGQQGSPGVTGAVGATGSIGPAGAQGIQGSPGITGATGVQGIQGSPGITGATGIQGIQGSPGITGATGVQGIQGSPGITGATGIQGIQGSPGVTGYTGSQGSPGVTGATGPAGINAYSTTAGFTQPAVGAAIAIRVPSGYWAQQNQYVYIASGGYYQVASGSVPTLSIMNLGYSGANIPVGSIVSSSFMSPAGIAGITGATGIQGIQGSPGVTGFTGAQGSPGVTGATGPQGPGTTGIWFSSNGVTLGTTTGVYLANNLIGSTGSNGFNISVTGIATGAVGIASNDLGGSYPGPAIMKLTGNTNTWAAGSVGTISVATGTQLVFGASGSNINMVAGCDISIGASPALGGNIRLSNPGSIQAINTSGTSVSLLTLGTSNFLSFGGVNTSQTPNAGIAFCIGTGAQKFDQINGVNYTTFGLDPISSGAYQALRGPGGANNQLVFQVQSGSVSGTYYWPGVMPNATSVMLTNPSGYLSWGNIAGITGATGPQGSPGVTGYTGAQGSPGVTGPQGPGVTGIWFSSNGVTLGTTTGVYLANNLIGSTGVNGFNISVTGIATGAVGPAFQDAGGSYPSIYIVNLTGSGANPLPVGTGVSILQGWSGANIIMGPSPALAGNIRFSNPGSIQAANSSASSVAMLTMGTSDFLSFGGINTQNAFNAGVAYNAGSGAPHSFQVNGTENMKITPTGTVFSIGTTGMYMTTQTGIQGVKGPICQNWAPITITGGTLTLSAAQNACPFLVATGTLSSAQSIIYQNPSLGAALITADLSGVSIGAQSLTFAAGTGKGPAISSLTSTTDVCMVMLFPNRVVISS